MIWHRMVSNCVVETRPETRHQKLRDQTFSFLPLEDDRRDQMGRSAVMAPCTDALNCYRCGQSSMAMADSDVQSFESIRLS